MSMAHTGPSEKFMGQTAPEPGMTQAPGAGTHVLKEGSSFTLPKVLSEAYDLHLKQKQACCSSVLTASSPKCSDFGMTFP